MATFNMRNISGLLVFLATSFSAGHAKSASFSLHRSRAAFRSFRESQNLKNVIPSSIIYDLRGGETRRRTQKKKKGRTASLHSTQKTATGKKKVGAAKKEEEKKSAVSATVQKYKQILPLTRIYLSMMAFMTVLGMVLGEEVAQGRLALDPGRVMYGLEVWRPITAATFFGTPSIGWLMSGYYLFQHGSSLERAYGTAQHLVFLLTQVAMLSVLCALFGLPFFANSVTTAMLHVLSRSSPNQKVKWLVVTVPYWTLPYGLMLTDMLQAKSPMAGLPHVLGILSGHFYYFHRYVWPKMGDDKEDWLQAPDFLVQLLDLNAKKDAGKEAVSKALKSRKRNPGRKLGGN